MVAMDFTDNNNAVVIGQAYSAPMFINIKQALGYLLLEASTKTLKNKVFDFPEAKSKFITLKRTQHLVCKAVAL